MTASPPVEQIVALMHDAGYDRLPQPVVVAGIPFDFSAVLVARSSLDLVVVVDTVTDPDIQGIGRRVEGLSRALDLVESRRPLTVIWVGPDAAPALQRELTRIARVLVAGVPASERELRDAIAVLLPLEIVPATELPESWRSARDKLVAAHPQAIDLLEAAKLGAEEVEEAARGHLLGTRGESQ